MPRRECRDEKKKGEEPPLTPEERAELKAQLRDVERKIAIALERQKQKQDREKRELRSAWNNLFISSNWYDCKVGLAIAFADSV